MVNSGYNEDIFLCYSCYMSHWSSRIIRTHVLSFNGPSMFSSFPFRLFALTFVISLLFTLRFTTSFVRPLRIKLPCCFSGKSPREPGESIVGNQNHVRWLTWVVLLHGLIKCIVFFKGTAALFYSPFPTCSSDSSLFS
jgi:hypothetical protein